MGGGAAVAVAGRPRYEFEQRFPDGVILHVTDRHDTLYKDRPPPPSNSKRTSVAARMDQERPLSSGELLAAMPQSTMVGGNVVNVREKMVRGATRG